MATYAELKAAAKLAVQQTAPAAPATAAPATPVPFDLLGRAIAIGREKTGERKFVVLALWLKESGGAWHVARHEVLDRSHHRANAEEQAQLEIMRRKDGDAEPAHRCEWPVGWTFSTPMEPIACRRSAIAKNVTPIDPAIFGKSAKSRLAVEVQSKLYFKLCESHRELLRDTYKLEVEAL